ncbi:MAG: membrane protein insertion efficiency factor YidD [Candidatus Theseobacter exili]|nr:membrane protein insertion efficiency factor YidD [Candidatus Theseobacter exili]
MKWILVGLIRLYQLFFSWMLGPCCRFEPSCSEYFIESLKQKGLIRGFFKGLGRLCRCHPFHPGGFDPVE